MSDKSKKRSKRKGKGTGSLGSFATDNPYDALAAIEEEQPPSPEPSNVAPATSVVPPSSNDLLMSTGSSAVVSSAGAAPSPSWASMAARGSTAALDPGQLFASTGSSYTGELPTPLVENKYSENLPSSSPDDLSSSLLAHTGSTMTSASVPAVSSSTGRASPSSLTSLLGSTRALTSASSAPAVGRGGGGRGRGGAAPAPVRNYLFTNFGHAHPPLTDRDESFALLVNYAGPRGIPRFRGLVRNMMAPDESRVLSVVASLDPATNGVRTKPVAERGVMQGDTVYHNFSVNQDLVMSNTAVGSAHSEVIGVSMVTQGEQVEGDPISFAVAFAGSTSLIFRGFKEPEESPYTAEPGHRFGLDFSAAAEETGRVDGLKRCVNVHRRARGVAGFCSSYFTALSPGVPGHKIHAIIDF